MTRPTVPLHLRPAAVEGLAELDARLTRALGDDECANVVLRWEIDGYLFLRLRISPGIDGGLRYAWLDDESDSVRREVGLRELEALIKRVLLEPAGEEILVFWEDETSPLTKFWAMIAAGDRLKCVWEPLPDG